MAPSLEKQLPAEPRDRVHCPRGGGRGAEQVSALAGRGGRGRGQLSSQVSEGPQPLGPVDKSEL